MLKKISECQNFGNPEIIFEFIKLTKRSKNTVNDLDEFFNNSRYSKGFFPQDIISLLLFLEIIKIEKNILKLTEKGENLLKKNKKFNKDFCSILILYVFEKLFLRDFLNRDDIKYDDYLERYTIKNSKVPFKYSPIKNLLIKFKILELNIESNLLVINKDCIEILKEIIRRYDYSMTYEELKKILLIKEKYGLDAEKFVLNYEKERIKNNPNYKKIQLISLLDVSAGYDVLSYYDKKSTRKIYIEVKSYSGKISFYWSKNEIKFSKYKQDDYYLYLVNRDKIKENDYSPKIIKNPYKKIFCDESKWRRVVESWKFKRK